MSETKIEMMLTMLKLLLMRLMLHALLLLSCFPAAVALWELAAKQTHDLKLRDVCFFLMSLSRSFAFNLHNKQPHRVYQYYAQKAKMQKCKIIIFSISAKDKR